MSEIFDKAKSMATDAADKVKDAVGMSDSQVDEAIDKASDAAQSVAPDAADGHIENVAEQAKDIV